MRSYVQLENQQQNELPVDFKGGDIRFPPSLVRQLLANYTMKGDIVFDPFAGFGTTLYVAEDMSRIGYGIEADEERYKYAKTLLTYPDNLFHGDSRRLSSYPLPHFDFSLTSPPYMSNVLSGGLCTKNPLAETDGDHDSYEEYLLDLQMIYSQMVELMKSDAHMIIEVSNLKHENGGITTLAWDIASKISKIARFEGEVVIGWEDTYGYGYDHSYCLVFKKP